MNEPETISPKSPVSETVPTDPPSSISAVLAGEPVTEDKSTAQPNAAVTDDQEPAIERVTEPEKIESPVETQATDVIPDVPLSSEPTSESIAPIESVASPKSDNERPEPSHAHTIDEAIADFQSAVKTPEPENLIASEELSAVERDNTADTVGVSATEKHNERAPAPLENGNTPEDPDTASLTAERPAPVRHSSDNISVTAPRIIAKTPPPPPKEPETTHDDEDGEGTTMEDIEID